jgi:hypothetical protein
VKGDRVEILVDVGDGVRQFDIVAVKAGRRVEVSSGRGMIEVAEVTRSGTPVRSARFMAARVVAVVEHPAADTEDAGPAASKSRVRTAPPAEALPGEWS